MASADGDVQPKADIVVAMEAWAAAFRAESFEPLVNCYAEDAILWGTFSACLREGRSAIADYFEQLFRFDARRVKFDNPRLRVFGSTALCTGTYTFSWSKAGKAESIPARYSFTYVNRDGHWLIVDHHSSVMPNAE